MGNSSCILNTAEADTACMFGRCSIKNCTSSCLKKAVEVAEAQAHPCVDIISDAVANRLEKILAQTIIANQAAIRLAQVVVEPIPLSAASIASVVHQLEENAEKKENEEKN